MLNSLETLMNAVEQFFTENPDYRQGQGQFDYVVEGKKYCCYIGAGCIQLDVEKTSDMPILAKRLNIPEAKLTAIIEWNDRGMTWQDINNLIRELESGEHNVE